jgi:ketosteroid isomerase-like protein
MKMRALTAAVLLTAALLRAQTPSPAPDAAELEALLREFLAGASRNDVRVHDRFWSDDLVYTGSSGLRRVGKKEVLEGVRSAPAPRPGDPTTAYGAEQVRVRQFGDTAVVDFQLVGTTQRGETTEIARYLNTGTFLKRNGTWKAVAWQATKVPRSEEEAKRQVAAAHGALVRALAAGDAKSLEPLVVAGFAGKPTDAKPAPGEPTISVYGDAAVVRSGAQTVTFVDDAGSWKAVSVSAGVP